METTVLIYETAGGIVYSRDRGLSTCSSPKGSVTIQTTTPRPVLRSKVLVGMLRDLESGCSSYA